MSTEIKLIAGLAALIAILGLGGFALKRAYDSGRTNGMAFVQVQWDQDKAAIQKVTDTAIAQATAERDMALKSNEAIQNDYQTKLSAAHADAAQFAERLRNAERIAANSSTVPKAGGGSEPTPTSSPSGPDQLGQLVSLVTGLRTECKANDDQLDALVAQINRQL